MANWWTDEGQESRYRQTLSSSSYPNILPKDLTPVFAERIRHITT